MNMTKDDVLTRFWAKVDKSGDCWVWTGAKSSGYGSFRVGDSVKTAHRVAWEMVRGPIPPGDHHGTTCVCHTCDNPVCVNPDHLFLGSQADNVADRDRKNRRAPPNGSKNGRTSLCESDVLLIREMDHPRSVIAEWFGISEQAVYRIRTRNTWAHI